jgi:hypothetical protein
MSYELLCFLQIEDEVFEDRDMLEGGGVLDDPTTQHIFSGASAMPSPVVGP